MHELRDAKENLERSSADWISPERAVAWLRKLSATSTYTISIEGRDEWLAATSDSHERSLRSLLDAAHRATDREVRVVEAVVVTGSETAAARRLGLSHSTVKHHLANARS